VYWAQATSASPVTTRQIQELNRKSELPVFSDAGSTAQGAMKKGWLTRNNRPGEWIVTADGAAMVERLLQ
jgi:hypothetical protein